MTVHPVTRIVHDGLMIHLDDAEAAALLAALVHVCRDAGKYDLHSSIFTLRNYLLNAADEAERGRG